MTELAFGVAVVLLAGAVVASFVPLVPGGLLSLLGVVGYWWATGWTEPGVAFVAVAAVVSLLVLVVDWLAGAVSAKAGGAATSTSLLAGVAGLVLFVVLSPLGGLLAVVVTVFAVEVYRGAAPADGAKAAVVTAVGMLASNVVQALLTGAVLAGFLAVTLL